MNNKFKDYIVRLSDVELLKIFPESKEVIKLKIKEYKEGKKLILNNVERIYAVVKARAKDKFSNWFWREVVTYFYGIKSKKYLEIQKNLRRLYVQLNLLKPLKNVKTRYNNRDVIKKSLTVPIESIAPESMKLKKSGNKLKGLCPFHSDKTPSFYIYPDNTFHCFGCYAHGNVIEFVKKLYNFSFREAINCLTAGKK